MPFSIRRTVSDRVTWDDITHAGPIDSTVARRAAEIFERESATRLGDGTSGTGHRLKLGLKLDWQAFRSHEVGHFFLRLLTPSCNLESLL